MAEHEVQVRVATAICTCGWAADGRTVAGAEKVASEHLDRDPYADCVCNHGRHTHARYVGACGLCDCPYVREANTGSTDQGAEQ